MGVHDKVMHDVGMHDMGVYDVALHYVAVHDVACLAWACLAWMFIIKKAWTFFSSKILIFYAHLRGKHQYFVLSYVAE